MKKILVFALVFGCMTIISCGNKSNGAAASADSANVGSSVSTHADAVTVTEKLNEALKAKDSERLKTVITNARLKISELIQKGNVEEAKSYLKQVQNFLNDNAETVKAVAADNAALGKIIDGVRNIPVETVNVATDVVDEAKKAAKDEADEVVEKANEKVKEETDKIVEKTKEKANKEVKKAAVKAIDALHISK